MKDQYKAILYKTGILLLLIIVISNIISFTALGIAKMLGYNYIVLIDGIKSGGEEMNLNLVRSILSINQIGTFLIPALAFAFFINNKQIKTYFTFKPKLTYAAILISIFMLLLCLPIVQVSFYLNQMVPLPDLFHNMEASTNLLIGNLLGEKTITALLFNLLLIGILPAIGEELIFRGIILKELIHEGISKNTAVVISAIIFSAFHLQFISFLPRFLLGLLLGYLFVWSGNLLLPIIIHFINNALQVLAIFLLDVNPLNVPQDPNPVIFGIAIFASVMLYFIVKNVQKNIFNSIRDERP